MIARHDEQEMAELLELFSDWYASRQHSNRAAANAAGATIYTEVYGRLEGRPVREVTPDPRML